MKKTLFACVIALMSTAAYAETLTVEFVNCSDNTNYICAQVYGRYGGQEMSVNTDGDTSAQIIDSMGAYGRSIAMNIEGTVYGVNEIGGGQHFQLQVNSLTSDDTSAPRPRGL